MKSNPLSLRLSYNKYWLNQDSIRFKNISLYYSYNINLDRLISNFLLSQKLRKLGIIYSHTVCKFNTISTYNVVKCVNKLIKLNIFLADIRLNDYIRNNRKRKKYKCIRKIFKVNKRNYWFRKQYSINCNKSLRIKQYNFMIRYTKEQYILTFIHFYMKLKSMKYFFKHLRNILFFILNLKQMKKHNKYLRSFKQIQYKVHYGIASPKHQFKKIINFQRKQNMCATKLLYIGWKRIKPHYTILKKLCHLKKLWLLYQQKLIKKKCRLYKYSHSFIYKSRIKYLLHANYKLYTIYNKNRYLNKIQINVMKNLYRRINLNKFLFIMNNIKELNKLNNLYLYRNKRQIRLKKLNNINFRKLIIQRLLYYYLRRVKNNITTVFGMSCLIKIYFIKNFLISPIVVVRYISFKLKMRYRIGELVKPIPKTYYRFGIANGIRIDCAGRFTRKQRASFSKYTRGSIAQTTISKYVSYDIGVSKSKYGACSVKYWLFH